jgi:probable HAF family extracellular repeat protein
MNRPSSQSSQYLMSFVGFAAALATMALPAKAQWYSVTDLSSVGGVTLNPTAINNSGTVVGFGNFGGFIHGFSYHNGVVTDLGLLPNASSSQASAINGSGIIAGTNFLPIGNFIIAQLTTVSNGTTTDIGSPTNTAIGGVTGINSSGVIIGDLTDALGSFNHAMSYTPGSPSGSFTDFGLLPGGTFSEAWAINSSGTIVGWADTDGEEHAVTYSNGMVNDLNWSAGSDSSVAMGINDSGTIVGYRNIGFTGSHAVSYSNGVFTELGNFPGGSSAVPTAINNSGVIVGQAIDSGGDVHGSVYSGGAMTDLNTLVNSPGNAVAKAFAINDSGQILAYGSVANSTLLLTPVAIHFGVAASPAVPPGSPLTVTVTALDPMNNPVGFYDGTVRLSSSDGVAGLPAQAVLSGGVGIFQVTLNTDGAQTITATDVATPSITGVSGPVTVALLPTIVLNPTTQTVAEGASVSFAVSAGGSPAPSYQWTLNGQAIAGATGSQFTITSAQVGDSGAYAVIVSNVDGSVVSSPAFLSVTAASGGPSISAQPESFTVYPGETIALSLGVSGAQAANAVSSRIQANDSGVTYQWYREGSELMDGSGVTGSESNSLVLSGSATQGGTYECIVANSAGSVLSQPAQISVAGSSSPGRLTNVSCRAQVGSGGGILIAGFVVGGAGTTGSDAILLRASGPALAPFNVPGTLSDPQLQLISISSGSSLIATNDGWGGATGVTSAAAEVGAFAWSVPSSHDSALVESLSPGSYTANISGQSGDTGVALAEVYDATPAGALTSSSPRLINVSARIQVGTAADVLIAGFVIGGTTAKTVLIRASGPALIPFNVPGTLADPELQLYGTGSGNMLLATNQGWGGNSQIAAAAASVGAFSWGGSPTKDSAILVTLPPGSYTANVSGASGDTGIALVEVYDVP